MGGLVLILEDFRIDVRRGWLWMKKPKLIDDFTMFFFGNYRYRDIFGKCYRDERVKTKYH